MPPQSTFTQELADEICERLASGESLRSICAGDGMPRQTTVFRWLQSNEAFREQYTRAREAQADTLFDEILDIADDSRNDWMERLSSDEQPLGWRENGEAIRRSHLRVEARKWMAGKLQAKKYGDKSSVDVTSGGEPIALEPLDVARRVAFLLTSGAKAAEK